MENQCIICQNPNDIMNEMKICKLCYNKVHKECTMFAPPESEERLPLRFCNRCFYIVDESIKTNLLDTMYRTLPQVIESDLAPPEVISEQEAFFEYYNHQQNRHYRFSNKLKIENIENEHINEVIINNSNPEVIYPPPPPLDLEKNIIDNCEKFYYNIIENPKQKKIINNEEIEKEFEPPALVKEDSNDIDLKRAIEESKICYNLMIESNSRKQEEEAQRERDRIANEAFFRNQEILKQQEELKKVNYNHYDSQHCSQPIPLNTLPPKLISSKKVINEDSGIYNNNFIPGHYPTFSDNDFSINNLPPAQPFVPSNYNQNFTLISSTIFGNIDPTPTTDNPPESKPNYLNYNPEVYDQKNLTTVDTSTPTYTYEDITKSRVYLPEVAPSVTKIPDPESLQPPALINSLINESSFEVIPVLQPKPDPEVQAIQNHESLISDQYSFIGSHIERSVNSSRFSFYQHIKPVKEDPKNFYQLIKKIGTGSIGLVYLARELSTNKNFAIKILCPDSQSEKTLILNEVNLTINSHHKNIIRYLKLFEHNNEIWIVEELMACSLADLILDRPGKIPERIVAYILKEILLGLSYMHDRQRIHRDMKSDNILLSLDGKVKIGDLGYCVQVSEENPNRQTFAGTLLWMAPEVLNQSFYSHKIDVWSLGIIALELIMGEPPYYRDGQQRIVMNITRKVAPRVDRSKYLISDELNQFICACLEKDPNQRADCQFLSALPIIINCPCDDEEFRQYFEEWKLNR